MTTYLRHGWRTRASILASFLVMLALLAPPAWAVEVYLNGVKLTGLKNAELSNCQVRFDANGDVQIMSPGYRLEYGSDGQPKIVGQSDMANSRQAIAKPKQRYVLVYEPNPKVNFAFEVWINGKAFRKIGLDSGRFTVEMTQDMTVGDNTLKVIAKPGDTVPGGSETDTASLRIFRGEAGADGVFRAKTPAVWELVRAAVDRQLLDRSYTLTIE